MECGVGKNLNHVGTEEVVAMLAEEREEAIALAAQGGIAELLFGADQTMVPCLMYETVHRGYKLAVGDIAVV